MPRSRMLRIKIADIEMTGILDNSDMANIIYKYLPLSGNVSLRCGEVYFNTRIQCEEFEGFNEAVGAEQMPPWPPGQAFYFLE